MRNGAIAALALTANCMTPPSPSGGVHPRHSLLGRVAGAPVQCVSRVPQEALLVLDNRGALSYRYGTIVYRTQVQSECPGLRPQSTIVVDTIGQRYCSGDRIKVIEAGARLPGHTCTIGPFVPYRPSR